MSTPASISTPVLSQATLISKLRAAGCVFAEDEARLLADAAKTPAELLAMVKQRTTGVPLEHILGWVDFCGLRIAVDPGVFVPRRRTEFLVRQAVARTSPGMTVVDLGCGAGAVGAAIAEFVGDITLHAVDIDPTAIRCARRNLAALENPKQPHQPSPRSHLAQAHIGDLYSPLPAQLRGHVDVLVANVPYVPTTAIDLLPPEARLYEPMVALDGGADGLNVVRRVAATAREWLVSGGHLFLEAGADQADAAVEALTHAGLTPAVISDEELQATVIAARFSQ